MQAAFNDGRREMLSGLNPEQVAEHAKRITSDPAFESLTVTRERPVYQPIQAMSKRGRKRAKQQRKHGVVVQKAKTS
jgi:hypothetical protein